MKVLIVDDHPLFSDGLKNVLETLAAEVFIQVAIDVEQAINQVEVNPNFDLILLDLNMPGIVGIDLIKILAERNLSIPVVLMSAESDANLIMKGMDAGALGFIPKSYNANKILMVLKLMLEGCVYLPDSLATRIEQLRRVRSGSRSVAKHGKNHSLTPRQYQVLELLCKGYKNRQIAQTLFLTEHTVKSHVKGLFLNLNADSRLQCVKHAVEQGIFLKEQVNYSEKINIEDHNEQMLS